MPAQKTDSIIRSREIKNGMIYATARIDCALQNCLQKEHRQKMHSGPNRDANAWLR
jgi:hypothetical protein